ncbi:hypothetical protein FRC06_007508 [Ceratobasidium sp. 370]|nr:hypothetical protein FRC06_007508 [Ceratobasidium sp. 370]
MSFRVEGVGDRDEFGPGGESERIMPSVESENAPALSQQVVPPSPRRSYGDAMVLPQTGSQPHSQSQGNSSKGTVVPDSQAQAQISNVPAKDPSPAKPHAAAPTSPARVALPKPKLSTSRTRPKLRPSEMLRLGRGIVIKPRPSVAETESTLIESIPPELAAAHGRLPSESEYEPEGSGSPEPSEVTPVTPGSSEETKTETEIDSNVDDDDEEIGRDGPSFRTRSQSFSQSRPKYQTFWPDSSPTRPKRPEFKGEEQAGALSPGENEANQEEVDERGPIPTSSPSLGGGRTGSVDLGSPESPTRRHRMTVEVVLPSPARPSQQTLSQATEAAASQEHVEQQELVTQETPLEDEGAQAQPDEGAGLENDQEDSPPLNDQDQSFAHAMEIDELLTDDASHQLGEGDMNIAAVAEGDPKHADTTGSVIDLSNTTADASDSILDLDLDATHTDNFMDHIQPVAEPPPALSSQPDSRIPASSSSFPQGPRATTPIPPAFLPPLLSDSSQSQRLPATLDPVPGSQNLASQPQLQPQLQPPSQPQDHTHSSIEETSSWSFPPPGQAPRPADTISSFTPTNPSESTTSPESRKALDAVLGIRFDRIDAGWVDSSGQSENKRMAEALKEAESKLAARDHRIVELTTELEQLAAEKSRAAAIFRDNMAQSEAIVQQQQEAYTLELADLAKTIADLRLQLMSAQTQSEIAESQRAAALEQYTIASNEVKPLADANRALNDRVRTLEKQVTAGLLHWQRGFESNMERKGQELKQLQAQLDLEREIRARTDGRDIRRRAAEWYELKKRVEDLEAESLQVEQEAQALRNREKELRLREQELAQREMALKNLPLQPSQSQGDRGLSQDDMQTETMLSDRSAVLAELDGPAGEDMVWMCTYRDSSDRLCGQAFETMGLLLTHVLDANGHKVDAGCQCG